MTLNHGIVGSSPREGTSNLKFIKHPAFMSGIRVLKRVARNKDNAAHRRNEVLISYREEDFLSCVGKLLSDIRDGERVYASVDARDILKAQVRFTSDLNEVMRVGAPVTARDAFFRKMDGKWASALGNSTSRLTKRFLFDWDDPCPRYAEVVQGQLHTFSRAPVYSYATKSGYHFVTEPFNPSKLPQHLALKYQSNGSLLWAYHD